MGALPLRWFEGCFSGSGAARHAFPPIVWPVRTAYESLFDAAQPSLVSRRAGGHGGSLPANTAAATKPEERMRPVVALIRPARMAAPEWPDAHRRSFSAPQRPPRGG